MCGVVQIIKLSDAVQSLPRQVTSCVHGVAPGFLEASARPDASARSHLVLLPMQMSGASRIQGLHAEMLLPVLLHGQQTCSIATAV